MKIDKNKVMEILFPLLIELPATVYEDIKSKINALPVSEDEWVSVSERLPNENQIVLAFGVGKRPSICEYEGGKFNRYVDQVEGERLFAVYYDKVTIWHELPSPPTK